MSDDATRTIGGQLARAAVLVSSGTLATLLVLNSGPGCDGPKSPGPAPKAEAAPAQPQAAGPAPTQPQAAAPTAPVEPVKPVPADSKEPAADAKAPVPSVTDMVETKGGPRYFPASKSGVFIEREPEPGPQPQPPNQANQAPSQQAPGEGTR